MDVLDLILIAICLLFGLSGYRQGFVIGVLSFAGFLGGGALGAKYASSLHSDLRVGVGPAMFGLLAVVLCAMIGQLIATVIGVAIRREFRWRPLRTADSLAGGVVSVVSVLLVAWLVGMGLAQGAAGAVSSQVNHSRILRRTSGWMIDSRAARAVRSAKTISPRAPRSSDPSGRMTPGPKRARTASRPAEPGATASRARTSASIVGTPSAANRARQCDFPVAMPPVSAARSIGPIARPLEPRRLPGCS